VLRKINLGWDNVIQSYYCCIGLEFGFTRWILLPITLQRHFIPNWRNCFFFFLQFETWNSILNTFFNNILSPIPLPHPLPYPSPPLASNHLSYLPPPPPFVPIQLIFTAPPIPHPKCLVITHILAQQRPQPPHGVQPHGLPHYGEVLSILPGLIIGLDYQTAGLFQSLNTSKEHSNLVVRLQWLH